MCAFNFGEVFEGIHAQEVLSWWILQKESYHLDGTVVAIITVATTVSSLLTLVVLLQIKCKLFPNQRFKIRFFYIWVATDGLRNFAARLHFKEVWGNAL